MLSEKPDFAMQAGMQGRVQGRMRSAAPRHDRRFHEGRRHKWDRTQHTCTPCLATVFQLLDQTLRAGLQHNMFRNQWTLT